MLDSSQSLGLWDTEFDHQLHCRSNNSQTHRTERVDDHRIKCRESILLLHIPNFGHRVYHDRSQPYVAQHIRDAGLVSKCVNEEDVSSRPRCNSFNDLLARYADHLRQCSKVETTPLAVLALHPQTARHKADQPLRDGQTQARTAIFPRSGPICLRKGVEYDIQFVLLDADAGIRNTEFKLNTAIDVCLSPARQRDLTLGGELDCITDQIGDDLS